MANFSNIEELIDYTNANITTNGTQDITGAENNNVLVGLADFIKEYNLNEGFADVVTDGGAVVLEKPITILTNTAPASVQWGNNVQNMFYIVNSLPVPVNLNAGFSYYDPALIQRTSIPAQSVLQIAKMQNGNWVQVNLPAEGGGTIFEPGDTPSVNSTIVSGILVNTVNISGDAGNVAEVRGDGIFVPNNTQEVDVGTTVSITNDIVSGAIVSTLNVSEDEGNAAEVRGNGLFVNQAEGGGGSFEGDAELL